MYKRILVPLDGSELAERILPVVERWAFGLGARVQLLGVVEEDLSAPMDEPMPGGLISRFEAGLLAQEERYLRNVAGCLSLPQEHLHVNARLGRAPEVIVHEAGQVADTLIAMSTRGRSGFKRFVLGSVANKVLHLSRVPLLLYCPRSAVTGPGEAQLGLVIVPLDGSQLAEQVLPHVLLLAKALQLTVVLTTVTPAGGGRHLGKTPHGGDQDLQAYVTTKQQELRKYGIVNVTTKWLQGDPAKRIADLVRDTPNSVVAISTHGRSGVQRSVLGSVADQVIRLACAPVLVIRPSDPLPGKEVAPPVEPQG